MCSTDDFLCNTLEKLGLDNYIPEQGNDYQNVNTLIQTTLIASLFQQIPVYKEFFLAENSL